MAEKQASNSEVPEDPEDPEDGNLDQFLDSLTPEGLEYIANAPHYREHLYRLLKLPSDSGAIGDGTDTSTSRLKDRADTPTSRKRLGAQDP